jgi:hypothetical protein
MFFNNRIFAFLWALAGGSEVREDVSEGVAFKGRPGGRFWGKLVILHEGSSMENPQVYFLLQHLPWLYCEFSSQEP